MVITAPESNHLDALTDSVETVFVNNRLPAEMLVRGRNGIKHRPFHMSFVNGARIMGRIPQRDGKGVKGCLCEGELVLTDQGFTPVEELRAGDKVVTHTGALKSIVRVAVDVNDCYEVRGAGSLPMRVSCDHRFYGAAEEGDGFSELFFADVETLVEDGFHWAMPTSFPALPVPSSDLPLQDPSFWGQLGERLAQECHDDDDDTSQFIAEHFSEGIPPFVLSLPLLCRKLLLEGFFGSRWHPEGEWVTTLEKRWALSVQMLLCSVGVQPELHAAEGGVVLRAPHSGRVARDGVMLGKVESVVPIGKQKVYNPIVEEDHSYISGSVISHNIHPIWLATDESQDFPEAGWLEIIETLKQGEDDAVWKCYGVTRGVRDKFYEFTQPDSGWEVHHYPAMYRPTWTAEEREAKIQLYGHRDNPDFRRNVYGLHGDATSPLFVLTRLMQCVQEDESDQYNTEEYWNLSIDEADIRDYGGDIMPLLDPPSLHKSMYKKFWIGMDVGFTNDPSVIVVFAEHKEKKTSPTALKLLAKVSMKRVSHGDQVQAIMWFIDHYRPSAFAMDRTGLGLPLFQHIQQLVREDRKLAHVLDRIKGYNFSEKIVAELDDTIEVDEYDPKALEKREIKKTVLEHSSDVLRGLVDEGRLMLPWDRDLIGEFKGQTYSYDKSTMDMYGRRRKVFSSGSYHTLDACRMAALAFKQHKIEEFLKEDRFEPVDAIILDL